MQRTQTNPRAETVPVLRVVVAKEGGMTSQHELATAVVNFGRSPECEVRLEGKNISRIHCILDVRADGNLWVRDNGSLNGIFVNGEKVKEAIITARDAVKVGNYRFKAIVTGTSTRSVSSSEARSVVPAAKPDLDRTLPAFDVKKGIAKDGPLPIEEEPLRAERPSTSTGVVLEDFVPPVMGVMNEDQTPADGTPVASPADELRAQAPLRAEVAPAAAPVAKPSYRSQLEAKAEAKADVKAEAPARVDAPRSAPAPRGRMSLTTPVAKRSSSAVRMGDLCQSCSTGRMLAWEGGLRCRKCDNRAEMPERTNSILKSTRPSSSRPSIVAKAPVAKAESALEAPAARTEKRAESTGAVKVGELCGSCYKGNMLKWEGGLRCRSCGNRAELSESTSSVSARPSSQRPSITPAARPSVVAKAPVAEARESRESSSTGTVKVGELCGSCYKGNMLTWEGGLRCRSCGNRAELGATSASSVKTEARQLARPAVAARTSASREEREPNRTVAVVLGVGLFFGLYITIGLCSVATAFLA